MMKVNFVFIFCVVLLHRVKSLSLHESCDIQGPSPIKGMIMLLDDCPLLSQIIKKNPMNENDMSVLKSRQRGQINGKDYFCCELELKVEPPVTVEPPSIPARSSIPGPYENKFPSAPVCGMQFLDRIIGGYDALINQYPWTAILEYTYPSGKKGFHCGGVLISDQYVLTASHCVNGKGIKAAGFELTGVRLGEWKLSTERDCDETTYTPICSDPHRDFVVEEIIPHEEYYPNSLHQYNDIALIRLSEKIQSYTNTIRPICLPIEESVRNFNSTDEKMYVTGWGKTIETAQSDIKQVVDLKAVDYQTCQGAYSRTSRKISPTQICAGGVEAKDSCNGDSGGPLMHENLKAKMPYWYLVGVVSFGPSPCGMKDWPGVYTRVGQYIDWIASNMKA